MTIHPFGTLERDPEIPVFFRSAPVAVPYFDGLSLPFIFREIEEDSAPGDFESAGRAFLSLASDERHHASDYVFRLYRRYLKNFSKEELGVSISSASVIWDFITPTEVHISRREKDQLIYVEILAGCRWDIEHGLVVIYREGSQLSRVSEQDGHLTTSDAFAFPDQRDAIVYEG